jgi:hypothetical protein
MVDEGMKWWVARLWKTEAQMMTWAFLGLESGSSGSHVSFF